MSPDALLEAKKNITHTVAPAPSLPAPRSFELPRHPENSPASTTPGHDFSRLPVNAPPVAAESCPMSLASPRACPFGGACHTCPARVQAKLAINQPGDVYELEADRVAEAITRTDAAAAPIHIDGLDEEDPTAVPSEAGAQPAVPTDSPGISPKGSAPAAPSKQTPVTTPCPTTVSVGAVAQRNHSNLSASEKDRWRTWLGAMSRMDVGPGPDHTGHCMKERLSTVSNNCPASMYTRGGRTTEPCSGDRCLDINRYGAMWGVSDGPTSFLDMHRTRAPNSLLEGTGLSSCSVVCEQTYTCDRTQPTTGRFRITRNFQAGTHTLASGASVHITTGTVTKTAAP